MQQRGCSHGGVLGMMAGSRGPSAGAAGFLRAGGLRAGTVALLKGDRRRTASLHNDSWRFGLKPESLALRVRHHDSFVSGGGHFRRCPPSGPGAAPSKRQVRPVPGCVKFGKSQLHERGIFADAGYKKGHGAAARGPWPSPCGLTRASFFWCLEASLLDVSNDLDGCYLTQR